MATLDVLSQIRSTYPTPLGNRHAEFLLECASKTGYGLLKKPNGNNITLPDGTKVAQDILVYPYATGSIAELDHFDFLVDGEGKAEVIWQPKGKVDLDRLYRVPTMPQEAPPVAPGTTPAPSFDPAPILAEIEALKAANSSLGVRLASLTLTMIGGFNKSDEDLAKLAEKLAPRTIRTEKGGGWLAHSHEVQL